jgi:hypothetical protein
MSHLLLCTVGRVFPCLTEAPHCHCLAFQTDDKHGNGGDNCSVFPDQHSDSYTTGCLDKAVSYA